MTLLGVINKTINNSKHYKIWYKNIDMELVCTTCFWNSLHQGPQSQEIEHSCNITHTVKFALVTTSIQQ